MDGFYVLIIGLPQDRDNEEWRDVSKYTTSVTNSHVPHITPIARNDTKLSYLKRPNEHPPLFFTRQWLQWRVSNNSQLHDLDHWILKRQEETHPHEQKPLQNSENCCNRRKDYNSSRLESKKKWWKNAMPKIARSPGQKSQSAPFYRYRYTPHNGKAR